MLELGQKKLGQNKQAEQALHVQRSILAKAG
ncbi:MAG: hypothetical protein ACI9FJ_002739 [Alteromonadaceae bacterium]|jgi:hypothetical protein